MSIERLTSLKNPRIQAIRSLRERKGRLAQGAFLVEGDKMVWEALASDFSVRTLLIREDREMPEGLPDSLPIYLLPAGVFDSLSETKTPQGLAAVVRLPEADREKVSLGSRLLALDGLQDPGNVGTILRTADAAGVDGVLLGRDCADLFSPRALRASMGSIFRMDTRFPADLPGQLSALREAGYSILSSQLDGEPFFSRKGVGEKWVLIIGNEGNGVSPEVQAAATHRLRLPMRGGAESLNAAVAAAIMMYELTQIR